MNKIYISGQISGHDLRERKEAFNVAAQRLHSAGYTPVNPFDLNVPDEATYEEHMKEDLKAMLGCDAIYMLKGWAESHGAQVENVIAIECGLKVIFE